MAAVAAQLAEFSSKADVLLDKHQHVLSELGLSIAFNRSTLATKYWLPLPDVGDFVSTTNFSTSIPGHGIGGQPLARVLEEGVRCLEKFDEVATQSYANTDVEKVGDDITGPLSKSLREVPLILDTFARAVHEVTKILDKCRDTYDSFSDNEENMSARLSPHASPDMQQTAFENVSSMRSPRETSQTLGSPNAAYSHNEWLGMGGHRAHQALPSDQLPDIFSGDCFGGSASPSHHAKDERPSSVRIITEPALNYSRMPRPEALQESAHRRRQSEIYSATDGERSGTAMSNTSSIGERRPRIGEKTERGKKAMLSKALQKANTAVLLDNAQNFKAASEAYSDACRLLQQVMDRSSGAEDKRKLDAIKITYTTRMEELEELEERRPPTRLENSPPSRPMSEDDSVKSPMMNPPSPVEESKELVEEPTVFETARMTRIVDWLDTIDESGSSDTSSVHSTTSDNGLHRKHIRNQSGETDPDFDAAFDAAVEAAYNEGLEPDLDGQSKRETIHARVRPESELLPLATFGENVSPRGLSLLKTGLNDGDDDEEEEERILDKLTQD